MSDSHPPFLHHHFGSMEQQRQSASLGMWLFIAQEIMFFGGLFTAYAVYRIKYPEAWAAGAAERLEQALNTMPGCRACKADGHDVLVLVTDTPTEAEERELRRALEHLPDMACLNLAFGEVTSPAVGETSQ